MPDVVLLQEVLGSARAVVRALNQQRHARRASARFAVGVAPRQRPGHSHCDGRRTQRHQVIRDSAIVVNLRTVRKMHNRGSVRTWGSWFGQRGCAEQPWALITVRHGDNAPRLIRVASVHIAPSNHRLKTRGVVRTAEMLQQRHRQTPLAALVIGGDLNLNRCTGPVLRPETAGCTVRAAHRHLLQHGLRDAVRSRHLHGTDGVVGVSRRIDFVYTTGRVHGSWFDRCYRAFEVTTNPCTRRQTRFAYRSTFRHCQYRVTTVGRPGGRCTERHNYDRYYSDHPILRATIS